MRAIWALALKDIRLLLRDKAGFFFTFCFPLVYALLFGAMFAGMFGGSASRAIKLALADLDQSDASRRLVAAFEDNPAVEVVKAESDDHAERLVKDRSAAAGVVIPSGYSQASERPFSGSGAPLRLVIDPSRAAERGMIEGLLMQTAYAQLQQSFTNPESLQRLVQESLGEVRKLRHTTPQTWERYLPLEQMLAAVEVFAASGMLQPEGASSEGEDAPGWGQDGWQPVRVTVESVAQGASSRPRSSWDITFPQGILWALMSCSFGFALSLVIERKAGTLTRLQMASAPKWQILAGKGLGCFLVNAAVLALLLAIGLGLGVRPDSMLWVVVAAACCVVAFVGIMMLLAVSGKTEASVNGIGWSTMLVMAMIGGGMMPTFFMPGWMQQAAVVSPIYWGIRAMEGAIWRGFSPVDMAVPCMVLLGIGIIGFLLGSRVFDWRGMEG